MIEKSKLYLVSSVVDESIKSYTPLYDIKIFRDVVELENFVNEVPAVVSSLVFTSNELPFNSIGMSKLKDILESPFMDVKDEILYLIDKEKDKAIVETFLGTLGIKKINVYQGDLSQKFIVDIISGRIREADESVIDEVTIRMRVDEYQKKKSIDSYDNVDIKYFNDEDILQGIPDEEAVESVLSSFPNECEMINIVGLQGTPRTLFAFLVSQYKSKHGKTVIIDKDCQYHSLLEFASKSGVSYEFIDVADIYSDISVVLHRIRNSMENLIVIGSIELTSYDYNYLIELLYSNLVLETGYFICERNMAEVPRGSGYILVMENSIPSILETCTEIDSYINSAKIRFVGVQIMEAGSANLTTAEFKSILEEVLEVPHLGAQVVKVTGLTLVGDGCGYDILGVLSNGRYV